MNLKETHMHRPICHISSLEIHLKEIDLKTEEYPVIL